MDTLTLEREALRLPPLARIRLADLLYSSLEVEGERAWGRKAAEECDSRWGAYQRGEMGSTLGTGFLDRIEAKYPTK
jgi:hypothetical protein